MDQRKQKALIVLGMALAATTSQAGIIRNVAEALAMTKFTKVTKKQNLQTPDAFRTLKFDAKSIAILEPLSIIPGSNDFNYSIAGPDFKGLTAESGKAGLRDVSVPGSIFTSGAKPAAVEPKSRGGSEQSGFVPLADASQLKPIGNGLAEAKAIFEAIGIAPGRDEVRLGLPKVAPLPAVHRGAPRTIGQSENSQAVFAATGSTPPDSGVVTTEGRGPITIAESKTKTTQDIKVSVVANNVELSRVLSILSDQTKANLLLMVPIDTKLTVRLQGVKFGDALKHICTLAGLSFVSANGAFILGPADKLKAGYPKEWKLQHPEDIDTKPVDPPVDNRVKPPIDPPVDEIIARTISTNYIDATSLAESIKALVGEGKLQVAAGPSQLSPSIVDRDTQQTTGVSTGVIQGDGRQVSRTLILRGPKSIVDDALKIARDLDVPRAQVAISVTIHDITDNALKELGVTWELGGFTVNETPSNNGGLNLGRVSRSGTSFTAALKGLEQTDKAKLLASPSVRVMDRERAFVLIGSRLKFPVVSSYSTTGAPIVTTQEEKVGVYLQVAPQIASDRTVTLTLYPQVSTVVSFAQIAGGSYPQIDSREAQTTLRVKSGETIVIGGLYKDEELSKIQQVPLLAQIPLIGELFKNRKKTKTSSQVIITLAIELVDPE